MLSFGTQPPCLPTNIFCSLLLPLLFSRKRRLIASFNRLFDAGATVPDDQIDDLIDACFHGSADDFPPEDLVEEPVNLDSVLSFCRQRRERFKSTPRRAKHTPAVAALKDGIDENCRVTRR